jgi:hypothetical protein
LERKVAIARKPGHHSDDQGGVAPVVRAGVPLAPGGDLVALLEALV